MTPLTTVCICFFVFFSPNNKKNAPVVKPLTVQRDNKVHRCLSFFFLKLPVLSVQDDKQKCPMMADIVSSKVKLVTRGCASRDPG